MSTNLNLVQQDALVTIAANNWLKTAFVKEFNLGKIKIVNTIQYIQTYVVTRSLTVKMKNSDGEWLIVKDVISVGEVYIKLLSQDGDIKNVGITLKSELNEELKYTLILQEDADPVLMNFYDKSQIFNEYQLALMPSE